MLLKLILYICFLKYFKMYFMNNILNLRDIKIKTHNMGLAETAKFFVDNYKPQFEKDNLWDLWMVVTAKNGSKIDLIDDKGQVFRNVTTYVSNDYLGYSIRSEVIAAGVEAMKKFGAGTCAAPIIGGFIELQHQLEKKIANFLHCDDALVYSSGFSANAGSLLALLEENDKAIVDPYAHASVYEGLYHTTTKLTKHNDPEYLDTYLNAIKNDFKTKLVIVDGVYSQDGDIGRIKEMKEICHKHGALLLVDDAHGIGIRGANGKGIIEEQNMLGQVDFITGTLSKAVGTIGGFFAGPKEIVEYLRLYARPSIFSAAPVPAVLASAFCAFELMEKESAPREQLKWNSDYLRSRLNEAGFDTGISESQIIPVKIGDDLKTKKAARMLLERNIYVCGITYPGVKLGDARLRLGITALHTKDDLDYFIESLGEIDKILHIRK